MVFNMLKYETKRRGRPRGARSTLQSRLVYGDVMDCQVCYVFVRWRRHRISCPIALITSS
jgi:hypothetical protein